jgi:hypothetical protein
MIRDILKTTHENLLRINVLLSLPQKLPIKLLLIHGLDDLVINYSASSVIYEKLRISNSNKDKLNIYFCGNADHGEVPFIGDFVEGSMR